MELVINNLLSPNDNFQKDSPSHRYNPNSKESFANDTRIKASLKPIIMSKSSNLGQIDALDDRQNIFSRCNPSYPEISRNLTSKTNRKFFDEKVIESPIFSRRKALLMKLKNNRGRMMSIPNFRITHSSSIGKTGDTIYNSDLKLHPKHEFLEYDNQGSNNISILQNTGGELLFKYMRYLANVDKSMKFGKEEMEERLARWRTKNNECQNPLGNSDFEKDSRVELPFRRKAQSTKIIVNKIDDTRSDNSANKKSLKSESKQTGLNSFRFDKMLESRDLPDNLVKDLAVNIRQLALSTRNENHITTIIEKIAGNNSKIIELILPKSHKLSEYELSKLEKRIKSIEMNNNENFASPQPKSRKSDGIIVEKHLIKDLEEFNKNLEIYNTQKKTESLKNIEDYLVRVGNKIKADELRLQKLMEKQEMQILNKNRSNIKFRSLIQPKYFEISIPDYIENFEKEYGEMNLVKRKNVSQSRSLKNLMDKWQMAENQQ